MPSTVNNQELERQFIIKDLPKDMKGHPYVNIRQGYLSVSEDREIRISAANDKYTLIVKVGQVLACRETEIPLIRDQFNSRSSAMNTH